MEVPASVEPETQGCPEERETPTVGAGCALARQVFQNKDADETEPMWVMKCRSLCILLLLLFPVLPAHAQDSYQDFEKGLNLSDTQRGQVEGIKKKYMDELRMLNNESARKRLELQGVDRNSEAGKERARKLESDLNSMQSSKESLYRRYRGEVSGVLNEQQRGRYEKFSDKERRRGPVLPPYQRGMTPPPRYRGHAR